MRLGIIIFSIIFSVCCCKRKANNILFNIQGINEPDKTILGGVNYHYKLSIHNNLYEKITLYLDNDSIFRPYQQSYYDCESEFIEQFNDGVGADIKVQEISNGQKKNFIFGVPKKYLQADEVEFIFLFEGDSQIIYDTVYYSMKNGVLIEQIIKPNCQ